MQHAASGITSLALCRLAAAAALRPAAAASFVLRHTTVPAGAVLYARRRYTARACGDRKAKAVSENEDEDEYEAMGTDEEFDGDFDDKDLEGLDDDEMGGSDDDEYEPVPKRGRP